MTVNDLAQQLQEEGYNPLVYSLEGGLLDNRTCIVNEQGKWRVYFSERGNVFDEVRYDIEDEACRDMLERLRSLPEYQTKW